MGADPEPFRRSSENRRCAVDSEGRIYLFSGDQYVRCSNWPQEFVDEGYPKRIAAQWSQELGFGPLPSGWDNGIDAAVERRDEVTWLFKEDHYVASTEPGVERNIVDFWGHVRNNLASASRVDAVLDIGGRCGVVAGDQVSVFSNSLETEGLTADEGYPRTLAAVFQGLPDPFVHGIDAGLTDENGTIHLFHDQNCATGKDGKWESHPTRERWGRVKNTLQETGRVDAALSGLDGKIYIFSGDQYVRYSGSDLSRIDEGYPRTISRDWGGLPRVDAAFVLDGKTYVFGPDHQTYVCYSTRDYTKPDDGYPAADQRQLVEPAGRAPESRLQDPGRGVRRSGSAYPPLQGSSRPSVSTITIVGGRNRYRFGRHGAVCRLPRSRLGSSAGIGVLTCFRLKGSRVSSGTPT